MEIGIMMFSRLLNGLILAAVLLPTAVLAQAAAPAPQAAGAATVTDNKAIGDWTVRCFAVTSASPCDMYEELQDKNSHQRVLGFSVAYAPKDDRHVVDIAVPLGVGIGSGAIIKTDSFTSPKLAYRRCDQQGCYVEGVMPNEMVTSLARSGPDASVNIVADDGKAYALKFSLNGFSAAHDAMAALAKEKAKDVPATPAAGADGSAPAKPAPAKKK
jgi:invasion protein IalB